MIVSVCVGGGGIVCVWGGGYCVCGGGRALCVCVGGGHCVCVGGGHCVCSLTVFTPCLSHLLMATTIGTANENTITSRTFSHSLCADLCLLDRKIGTT